MSYRRIDTLCTFGSMRNRNTSECLVGDADTGVMLGLPHHVMQLPYPYPSTKPESGSYHSNIHYTVVCRY